jgi:hypothetical protein
VPWQLFGQKGEPYGPTSAGRLLHVSAFTPTMVLPEQQM